MITQRKAVDAFLIHKIWPIECLSCVRDAVCELMQVPVDVFHAKVDNGRGRPQGSNVTNAATRQLYCYMAKRVFFINESLRNIGSFIYDTPETGPYSHASVIRAIDAIEDRLFTGEIKQSLIDYLSNQITLKLEELWQSSPLAVMPGAERTQQVA